MGPRDQEDNMRYLLLIAEEEGVRAKWSQEDQQADMAKWFSYTNDLQEAGALVDGVALNESSTATTVRVEGGETLTTDGPFAETKEIINGYYLIDVDDLDSAISWAARIPTLGAVEVRPVLEFDMEADA
jgi:hypothetical protein